MRDRDTERQAGADQTHFMRHNRHNVTIGKGKPSYLAFSFLVMLFSLEIESERREELGLWLFIWMVENWT